MKLKIACDYCGKIFERDESHLRGKRHHFCSRQCLADYSNKAKNPNGYLGLKDYSKMAAHFSRLSKQLNPSRMTPSTREKLRQARLNSGEGKTYTKRFGRHEHRVVAEQILGRPLKKGEVVHHRDGNKRNNSPENLMVFPSQAEHARYHALQNNPRKKEVVPDEVHSA